mgnify:CR=1 FL=1
MTQQAAEKGTAGELSREDALQLLERQAEVLEMVAEGRELKPTLASIATALERTAYAQPALVPASPWLGLVPLVIASGAGAATQRAVGTAVFGGMLAASFLGIFVIPGLYVVFQTFREKVKSMLGGKTPAPTPAGNTEPKH